METTMTENHKKPLAVNRRRFLGMMGAGCMASILPGWAHAVSTQDSAKPLVIRIGADISILDPARIFQIENQSVAANIYNGLVKYDAGTNHTVTDLAVSWEVSPDARNYTLKLRAGVKWHQDFGDFSSEQVKFSLDGVFY